MAKVLDLTDEGLVFLADLFLSTAVKRCTKFEKYVKIAKPGKVKKYKRILRETKDIRRKLEDAIKVLKRKNSTKEKKEEVKTYVIDTFNEKHPIGLKRRDRMLARVRKINTKVSINTGSSIMISDDTKSRLDCLKEFEEFKGLSPDLIIGKLIDSQKMPEIIVGDVRK